MLWIKFLLATLLSRCGIVSLVLFCIVFRCIVCFKVLLLLLNIKLYPLHSLVGPVRHLSPFIFLHRFDLLQRETLHDTTRCDVNLSHLIQNTDKSETGFES